MLLPHPAAASRNNKPICKLTLICPFSCSDRFPSVLQLDGPITTISVAPADTEHSFLKVIVV